MSFNGQQYGYLTAQAYLVEVDGKKGKTHRYPTARYTPGVAMLSSNAARRMQHAAFQGG